MGEGTEKMAQLTKALNIQAERPKFKEKVRQDHAMPESWH